METYLTFDNKLRVETDATVIATLKRKGWQDAPKPSPEATWQDGKWVMPPPPPDYKIWPNIQAFMAEFTMPELAGIGISTDPTVAALRVKLSTWLTQVNSDSDEVQLGLSKLVELGIITAQRKESILSQSP